MTPAEKKAVLKSNLEKVRDQVAQQPKHLRTPTPPSIRKSSGAEKKARNEALEEAAKALDVERVTFRLKAKQAETQYLEAINTMLADQAKKYVSTIRALKDET